MTGSTFEIKSGSGFTGYLALPDASKAPGIILIQEIFGVNSHIRQVADLYAAAGYVVLAPDVFWRAEPHVELGYTPDDIQKGIALVSKSDNEQLVGDMIDAVQVLRKHPNCSGKVAAVGYCMGGYLSYRLATKGAVDAAVCYYGGRIDQALDEAKNLHCPIMMHFGEKDSHIPAESVAKIRDALKGKEQVEILVYPGADHGFNCDQRPSYDRQSAMLAFGRSMIMLHTALA
jgi:carboxymethylenebutenolidase